MSYCCVIVRQFTIGLCESFLARFLKSDRKPCTTCAQHLLSEAMRKHNIRCQKQHSVVVEHVKLTRTELVNITIITLKWRKKCQFVPRCTASASEELGLGNGRAQRVAREGERASREETDRMEKDVCLPVSTQECVCFPHLSCSCCAFC